MSGPPDPVAPEDRARRAWEEFCAVMREIIGGEVAWALVRAGGDGNPSRRLGGGPTLHICAMDGDTEIHREIAL